LWSKTTIFCLKTKTFCSKTKTFWLNIKTFWLKTRTFWSKTSSFWLKNKSLLRFVLGRTVRAKALTPFLHHGAFTVRHALLHLFINTLWVQLFGRGKKNFEATSIEQI
jgi:hypothetical protein